MQIPTIKPPSLSILNSNEHFPVRRVYCIGRNYADHVKEMGGDPEGDPIYFMKPADAVTQGTDIPYPPMTSELHHEVELVIAIGKGGADIAESDAEEHVYGLAVGVDLTRRDRQAECKARKGPWEIAKAFDHSAPIGLMQTTAKLPKSEDISLSVNGEIRQSGDLSQMIWSPAKVISYLSRSCRLEPGDLIFTGTPEGVGPLVKRDRIEAKIEGLPELSFNIV